MRAGVQDHRRGADRPGPRPAPGLVHAADMARAAGGFQHHVGTREGFGGGLGHGPARNPFRAEGEGSCVRTSRAKRPSERRRRVQRMRPGRMRRLVGVVGAGLDRQGGGQGSYQPACSQARLGRDDGRAGVARTARRPAGPPWPGPIRGRGRARRPSRRCDRSQIRWAASVELSTRSSRARSASESGRAASGSARRAVSRADGARTPLSQRETVALGDAQDLGRRGPA